MCITIDTASLSKTKILSLKLENGNHFLAYSNKVQNLSVKPNAMIFAIPGKTRPELFHNTEKYKDFLNEITKKATEETYTGLLYRSAGMKSKGLERFNLGIYNIGLSDSFDGISEFFNSLSEKERPEMSEELQKFFKEKYVGWSFAICVFSSSETIDAQPIAFEYEPFNSDVLYFPTADGHDGGAPKIGEQVDVDHTFIFEHTGSIEGMRLAVSEVELGENVPEFLRKRRYWTADIHGKEKNEDTYIRIDDMTFNKNFMESPEILRGFPILQETV